MFALSPTRRLGRVLLAAGVLACVAQHPALPARASSSPANPLADLPSVAAGIPQPEPVLAPVDPQSPGTGAPLRPAAVRKEVLPEVNRAPGQAHADVVDVASGKTLSAQGSDIPAIPASTMKLVTALSVGQSMGPQERLRTATMLQGSGDVPTLVLRGAGDATLMSTAKIVGSDGSRAHPATTKELAARTVRELSRWGVTRVRLSYDDSLFTGPDMGPGWQGSFPAAGVIAPVSALMVDQGRVAPGALARSSDPAALAAVTFSKQLEQAGLVVVGDTPTKRETTEQARLVASVSSPTVAEQVERMLSTSDNDIAEALFRLAALADGLPGSFAGGAKHSRHVVAGVGIDLSGLVFKDGSGLSRQNRLTAAALTQLLVAVARSETQSSDPAVAGVSAIRSGLPVAGATGSLRYRFGASDERAGRGLVRAKTGTLTGVISLAGYATRPDGRLVAFAFLDNEVAANPGGARAAFDAAAATIVSCDCAAE